MESSGHIGHLWMFAEEKNEVGMQCNSRGVC